MLAVKLPVVLAVMLGSGCGSCLPESFLQWTEFCGSLVGLNLSAAPPPIEALPVSILKHPLGRFVLA